jgi:signal transduction histidine kinase
LGTAADELAPARRRASDRRLAAVEGPAVDFELLFRSAPSLLVVLDPAPDLRIVAASDAYLRAARCPREKAIGRPFFDVFPERLEAPRTTGAASLREALHRVLATAEPDALNSPIVDADGSLRYIIHRIDAMELEVLRSVQERDAALRHLRDANEDVEAHMQAARREFQPALRAIDGSCRLFAAMQGSHIDARTRRLLTRIGANVNRMETIIDGLLGLSRAARVHMACKRVDVSAAARRAVGKIAAREPQRTVAVDVAQGLEAWADESLVAIILENIIGNAWKYTRRRDDARIEVGARKSAGRTVFHVRDNGVGFDMALADRLFAPFVRLHDGAEFEGYGIGLTSAKRIVERHGGEIWAESKPGEGATIHFTLGTMPG